MYCESSSSRVQIELIEINPNLPEDPPIAQEEIPLTAVAIKKWEIEDEKCTDFHNVITDMKTKMKALLPIGIFESLVIKAGIQGCPDYYIQ